MKRLIKWTALSVGVPVLLFIFAAFADPYITVWSANKAVNELYEHLTASPDSEQLALKNGDISVHDTVAYKRIEEELNTSSPSPFASWSPAEDGVAPKTIDDWRRQEIIFPSVHYFSLVHRFVLHGLLKDGDYHDRIIDATHYIYRDGAKFSIHPLDKKSIGAGEPGAAPVDTK